MSVELRENLGPNFEPAKGNKWKVKVIEAGWGSSGYYPAEMLREYGPNVFKKGTKVFMNHPSINEENDRPERDVEKLAGKLTSDAYFTENGLVAEIQFYSHYAPIIKEMYEDVGLSIRALGEASVGEAEGREGPIIESLVADALTSVDVVTVAGAGGKFISLLESYTRKDTGTVEVTESLSEGNGMSISKEEFDAAIADLKAAFVEAISPVIESVSILAEAAKPAEEDVVSEEETLEAAIDPVDVATKFNESGLPKLALQRVAEAMKAGSEKSVDELIEDEKAYVTAVSESVSTPAADTFGVIHEATNISPVDELDAIVSRIAGK